MSCEVWVIIGAFILFCFLVCASCANISGQCSDQERQEQVKQEAYQMGYDAGYLAGDRDGYKAGLRMTAARVDVAPGRKEGEAK